MLSPDRDRDWGCCSTTMPVSHHWLRGATEDDALLVTQQTPLGDQLCTTRTALHTSMLGPFSPTCGPAPRTSWLFAVAAYYLRQSRLNTPCLALRSVAVPAAPWSGRRWYLWLECFLLSAANGNSLASEGCPKMGGWSHLKCLYCVYQLRFAPQVSCLDIRLGQISKVH